MSLLHTGNADIPGCPAVPWTQIFKGKLSITSPVFSCHKKDPEILPQTKLKSRENPKRKRALGNWCIKDGQGRFGTLQNKAHQTNPERENPVCLSSSIETAPKNQAT